MDGKLYVVDRWGWSLRLFGLTIGAYCVGLFKDH